MLEALVQKLTSDIMERKVYYMVAHPMVVIILLKVSTCSESPIGMLARLRRL